MKFNYRIAGILFWSTAFTMLFSCRKDDSEREFGFSKIYMPQSIRISGGVDNQYPVPFGSDSSSYNYIVDEKTNSISVILGASLSGPGSDAYTVDISVDTDTVQQLLSDGTFDPATHQLMPSSLYTIPDKLEVAGGDKSGTFSLSVNIEQLKETQYEGKILLLAVKIANPSKYELNTAQSTTIVVLDVNGLVIGPAVNVTGLYIKNAGNPFKAGAFLPGSTRWGNLQAWSTNEGARNQGGYGGFNSDKGGTMGLESGWGSPMVTNGKIWQTVTLPAGTYSFDISGGNWDGGELFLKDVGYVVVAPDAEELPDYNNIENNPSVLYKKMANPQPLVDFQLSATTTVTLGVVVSYPKDEEGFKTKQVILRSYPKHL